MMTGGTGAAGAAANGSSPDEEQLPRLLDGMDLSRKVGRLFVTRVYGHRLPVPVPPLFPLGHGLSYRPR